MAGAILDCYQCHHPEEVAWQRWLAVTQPLHYKALNSNNEADDKEYE
jgi:hypothetical protein